MDSTMRRRVLDDRKIYQKPILDSGLQITSQTWRLIDWARCLPLDAWNNVIAGVDEAGIVHYMHPIEALRLRFEHERNKAFADLGANAWMVRPWEPMHDEWGAVLIALHELEANQRLVDVE